MLRAADAPRVAAIYGLEHVLDFTGPVARGVIGQIWRLDTSAGSWAVKEWFDEPDRAEVEEGARFQLWASDPNDQVWEPTGIIAPPDCGSGFGLEFIKPTL